MIDASVLVDRLLRTGNARSALSFEPEAEFHVPSLCDIEVVSTLRRFVQQELMGPARAAEAISDYLALALWRHGHRSLLPRIFELRENITAYDACYVALAENLKAGFVTSDGRLVRAVRALGTIEVIES